MINPSAGPIYRQIADDLREQIRSGHLPPGSRLPSEKDLQHEYGHGYQTIRAALDLLVQQGLIVKRHGGPTRVRDTPAMATAELPAGHVVGARPATDEERARWDLPPGSWVLVAIEEDTGVEWDSWPADRTRLRPASG